MDILPVLIRVLGTIQSTGYSKIGSDVYTIGLLCLMAGIVLLLTVNGENFGLFHSDEALKYSTIIALILVLLFQTFSPLRMFVLGLTVTVVPAVGLLVIYLLMEVPIGE